ncbi:MAG TPA: hypothetical protein VMD51_14520, partial [Mycobacterium sp.]|nr:hypothetical protein [Mycobacterium sp.]
TPAPASTHAPATAALPPVPVRVPTRAAASSAPAVEQPVSDPTPTTADATALRAAANTIRPLPATKKTTAKPSPGPTTIGTPGRHRREPKSPQQPPAPSPTSTDSVS